MNILALDTSGPVLSVALQAGKAPLSEKIHFGAWEHMENLLPFADQLLQRENLTPAQIDYFLINRGPGSFTGLRIGFSVLKGFMAAAPKPCFSRDSLDALAERIPCSEKKYLAICLDAFRAKFYVKIFENSKGRWQPLSEPEALEIQTAIQKIPADSFIAGDALKRFRNVFENAPLKNFQIAEEDLWYPRAASLIRLHQSHPQKMKKLVTSEDFLPFYLRQSEPEERRNEKMSSPI